MGSLSGLLFLTILRMIRLWFLVFLLGVSYGLKHLEQREIKTSNGKTFTCFYTITYKATGQIDKKKTKIECDPNDNGKTAIEVFDLPDLGKVSVKHNVNKGKGKVQDFSPFTESDTSVMPMNCSCKVPFPTEMMEMMEMPSTAPLAMGRRLAPMLMTHDTESNRKVLKVERGLNRIGPLCLFLLIPQIIAAIQAALAGRSLDVSKEALAAKFNRQLFGGLGSNIGSGGLLAGGLGNGGLFGGATGGGSNPGDLIGTLTGGATGGNPGDLLGSLLGGGGTGGADPAALLGALTGSGGDPAALISALAGGGDISSLLSNPLVQQMIQQVVQQQMEEFLSNGGPEEIIGQIMAMSDDEIMAMIMPYIPEDMQQTVQEIAAMSDEEFMQHVMEQMGMTGGLEEMFPGMGAMGGFNMTDLIQEWEAPFDVFCDCLPAGAEHGILTV